MGFLTGSMTFERYWITEDPTSALGPEHLEVLEKHQIRLKNAAAAGEPTVGYLAGAHVLDVQFDLEKNIFADALHFGVRIDTHQIPSVLRKAWLQMELAALTADNPSGKPTKAQRQEAKESVEARCEEEIRSGKYRRMQHVSVVWDAMQNTLYLGGTSASTNELCIGLLERTFEIQVERVTSGKLARAYATNSQQTATLHQLSPAPFWADESAGIVTWWNGMAENFDYLGNEFLLWLWWRLDTQSDTIRLSDETMLSGMFARSLTLDCARGESGRETISADSPIAIPEARLGIQSGKLPRRAGLTLVRHDLQFDFAIQAEEFTVSSAKISHLGGHESSDRPQEDRIHALRDFTDTLDRLFETFCERRLGKSWKADLKKIREWLGAERPADLRRSSA